MRRKKLKTTSRHFIESRLITNQQIPDLVLAKLKKNLKLDGDGSHIFPIFKTSYGIKDFYLAMIGGGIDASGRIYTTLVGDATAAAFKQIKAKREILILFECAPENAFSYVEKAMSENDSGSKIFLLADFADKYDGAILPKLNICGECEV